MEVKYLFAFLTVQFSLHKEFHEEATSVKRFLNNLDYDIFDF